MFAAALTTGLRSQRSRGNAVVNGSGSGRISTFSGNDTIVGGAGDDVIDAGVGDDVLIFGLGDGDDVIADFETGTDVFDLSGLGASFDSFGEVIAAATQVGGDVLIDFGGGDSLRVVGTQVADFDAGDFTFG